MALLTTPYRQPGAELISSIASIVQSGSRLSAEHQARQESMAQRLAAAAIQQQQFQRKLEFDREQEARMQRAMDVQEARYQSIDERDRIRLDMEKADREPFTIPSGGGSEGLIPVAPSPGELLLGKVTSYGYSSDPYGDSASLGTGKWKFPTGAWNNKLRETSMAISPDVEAAFKAAGIGKGDSVALQLADGSVVNRTWDDRTMQDEQAIAKFGKPLRGRFDFYNPGGEDRRDGVKVVGFRPTKALGSEMIAGAPAAPAEAPSPNPRQTIQSVAQELASMGIPKGEARKILAKVIPEVVTQPAQAATRNPLVRSFPDGSLRQYDQGSGAWSVLQEAPSPNTSMKEVRAAEDQLMQKLNLERNRANDIERELARIEKADQKPSWPWEEDGKLYKMDGEKRREIERDEYDLLEKKANESDWAKRNDELAKRRAKMNELQAQLEGGNPATPPTAAATAPIQNPPDMKALAQKALDDPAASEVHKAAARKLLGMQ